MELQSAIKNKGLKQKWIAEQLGVTGAMLSMYLRGKTSMSPEKVRKLKLILK
ncbi:helix-turn-helix domain-containing protein [Paenibacillus cremeus]|nr:helix-turn-helix transcriptional regulator [Paenibacillus cremeus]